ncbi:MAG: Chaperone protein HscB [uncultured Thiotrichaceae bacterium]|uniref:Co-chaperone protein HscB homolog n=1 Tax=uncultured Thiotrichaceae bacterium TaxID=298394 RepID=A0A6S6SBU5_9GAMM|nr:MAG: Chaperone protein HscB [uncultured Thiotrichaceae bacterium]
MPIDLKSNYFELFGLPNQFEVDTSLLATRFRALQSECHPDQFVNGSDEEKRISMQQTAFVNEASDTLKNPRLRARYMLASNGVDFTDETDLSKDPAYLMEQMELRESIENAENATDPFDELDDLRKIILTRRGDVENDFQSSYASGNMPEAKQAVLKMRFCERIIEEIQRIEERLEDELI